MSSFLGRPFRHGPLAVLLLAFGGLVAGQEVTSPVTELPSPLAPLEFLVGRWKGQGVPKDNPALRFRGWTETHTWAWAFAKGQPVGLVVRIEGGKGLSRGTLTFDPRQNRFRMEADSTAEAGRKVVYAGQLDSSGKRLVLESSGGEAPERLTLRANSNYLRYTMILERREPGASGFTPRVEVGVTKEGESFAAGASTVERPRCIVTGGAATLTVSYRGQDYPICCTGCRDEFNESPEKYLKKLSLRGASGGEKKAQTGAASKVSRFEDAFAGDVGEEVKAMPKAAAKPTRAKDDSSPSTTAPVPKSKPANRAATALRLAQNLEKSSKRDAALKAYRKLVKDFPDTPEAATATARIRSIESP